MFFVYILQSLEYNRFYTGVTQDLEKRIKKHNNGLSKSTKPYRPWVLIYIEKFNDKKIAYKREYYLKQPSGYKNKLKIIEQYKK
jgi:putative endonuclease